MTRRLLTSVVTICVFAWLMPLGAFIKPSQEGVVCGGKRAFHMCCCLGKLSSAHSTKPGINSASGFNENAKSSTSGGEDFLPADSAAQLFDQNSRYYEVSQNFLFQSSQSSIFHPPKALPLF